MRKPLDPMQRLSQWLRKLESRVKTLETAPRLQNSSISKGALRILSPEGLIVVGSASVSGLLDVDGTLDGTGSFDWSGPWELSGAGQITGDVTATGTWTWQGDLNLSGDMDVTGDITILPGGRIVVDDMIIDPADGGSVKFPNNAVVSADDLGGVQMRQGTASVFVGPGMVAMQLGTRSISITNSGIQVSGMSTLSMSLAPAGAFVGAVIYYGGELVVVTA